MKPQKKVYVTPRLTVHGDVERITLGGGSRNGDGAGRSKV